MMVSSSIRQRSTGWKSREARNTRRAESSVRGREDRSPTHRNARLATRAPVRYQRPVHPNSVGSRLAGTRANVAT